MDGGTATYHGHVYSYIPQKNSCLGCDPMREREREDLAACTLVGKPRKKNHCLLKGQLAFEEKEGRLPDANDAQEVKFVHGYANDLAKEYFPHEPLFTLDDVVHAIDHHEPAIITVNAVIASLQSQDSLRILHHLKGTELGSLPLEYTVYNGLYSNFFRFDKPPNPKCTVCGPDRPKTFRMKAKRSMTFDMILKLLKKQDFKWEEDMPPLVYRMDSLDMDMITEDLTFEEFNARNKEIYMISGIEREGYDKDLIYLQIVFA